MESRITKKESGEYVAWDCFWGCFFKTTSNLTNLCIKPTKRSYEKPGDSFFKTDWGSFKKKTLFKKNTGRYEKRPQNDLLLLGSRIFYMLQHVTDYFLINFINGLSPFASEAHCGYTSLHEYVITIL